LKVPLSWLRDYVSVEMPLQELADRLAVSTCEVDRISHLGVVDEDGNLGHFVVGKVLEAAKHPNADKLQLCLVDVGEAEPRSIVCGAWNFGAVATVAVAVPGAVIPGGLEIESRKLRGEVSDGMILSERELELGQDHSGIMVLEDRLEPGTPLADVLPLAEDVLEVEVTGNRSDLLAIYGLAREVAALYELELSPPPGRDPELVGNEPVEIEIADHEGCPRFIGRLLRDVTIGPSPVWLRARLTAAGMRPISNVVDATNYAMLALGSPLHAYDLAKLGHGARILVRRALPGEELRTLDDTLRRLDPRDLVITDGEHPVALAGIMGGLATEVDETTTEVLLEAANFEPAGIQASSERLGLRTEGSNRWEKGVDPYLAGQAATLATALMVEHAGARWVGQADLHAVLPAPPVVRLRPERSDALIGLAVPPERQRQILTGLGFEVGTDWEVTVPTWRARDVYREVDVIEEIARFELDEVPFTMPVRRELFGRLTRDQRLRRRLEDVLAGAGFAEVYTPSLVPADSDPGALALPEPLSAEQAVLRTNLVHGLVETVKRNLDAGNEEIALFELARVYLPSGGQLPDERWHLAGILEGGFARAKGAVELVHDALGIEMAVRPTRRAFLHPGKAAELAAGVLGELHPLVLEGGWGFFELDAPTLLAHAPDARQYVDVITYPALKQDLAFVVDEDVPAGDLIAVAREAATSELREMRVFDVYRGEQAGPGRKSIAFRVEFQSPERTLTDEDAAALRERIVAALADRFGATLRA
jgi:phenylalanyl-tRNA synthetase beta chain